MSHFILTAYDYTDEGALDRRMAARTEHFQYIDEIFAQGKVIMGGARLDDNGKMIGSTIVFEMTQAELDEYMQKEPYITQKVWEKVEVSEYKVGPRFLEMVAAR